MLLFVRGREKETETHIIISLLIARNGESNPACRRISHDPPLQSVACDVVPLHDNNMDVDAEMTGGDVKSGSLIRFGLCVVEFKESFKNRYSEITLATTRK